MNKYTSQIERGVAVKQYIKQAGGEEMIKLEWPSREVQVPARSMDMGPARRKLSVKLNHSLARERLRSGGGRSVLMRQSQSLLGLLDLAGKAARLVV